MDALNKTLADIVGSAKSWIPWRSEPDSVSRDFWMPDQSCRVCYECDSQFTVLNRRHHCRLCGRVFCANCTVNSIPAPSSEPGTVREEWERIKVCNYCFEQWEQGMATLRYGNQVLDLDLSPSPSAASSASSKSGLTTGSSSFTFGSIPCSVGMYRQDPSVKETSLDKQADVALVGSNDLVADTGDPSPDPYKYLMNRSDDDDDDYGIYRVDYETRYFPQDNEYYCPLEFDEMRHYYASHKFHLDGENIETNISSGSLIHNCLDSQGLEGIQQLRIANEHGDDCEEPSSIYAGEDVDTEPVDFENNGLLWLPPEPEDEEDERETVLSDDDDGGGDDVGDAGGEWGYLRSSSGQGSREYRSRDKSTEVQKKAMKNVVDGHFRALVAQLLQVENIPIDNEDDRESWLEIITSLSWEAAHLLKPDMSKGGGMDPGGYVKVKCLASGRRCESMVVKGVVCKKNVAHRRMTSKVEKPRLLILGGALEYQRVSNLLSSFDTLLQQEMDHLKMAVAKIAAHKPNVLLVEKSVSRFAQDYLLAKDISLVLNIKRPLLERIARCTGTQIVPSIDHLSSQKLGSCDMFRVERFSEDLGTAGQGGKKLVKTLMYFEGCPKPLGFTILLRGANGDELKKVKHVVQYGVFAAYHLSLETSFLADEGATLPEFPLSTPITVALPSTPSTIDRSISTVLGFNVPANEKAQVSQPRGGPQRSNSVPTARLPSSLEIASVHKNQMMPIPSLPCGPSSQSTEPTSAWTDSTASIPSAPSGGKVVSDSNHNKLLPHHTFEEKSATVNKTSAVMSDHLTDNGFGPSDTLGQGDVANNFQSDPRTMVDTPLGVSEESSMQQDDSNFIVEPGPSNEEFPPSPSDHQSILVSLSSRCVWKGTVCERSHLFRIKYYGSFDKPLGRYLRDHLFDQSYRCCSCEMPSEAHVQCYTHRQGSLTISVKKLPEMLLPGEKDGKIWMWHRCLRCPRTNGFPPATRRIVMSDAAWGLSFGKFLELSFSNHAAASRVASCGHSLHRDCLRFYGFGKMVACFYYASIDVHLVYLPPSKLDFNFEIQEWIQKEMDEVAGRAEMLFSEVLKALSQIIEKKSGIGPLNGSLKPHESIRQFTELEAMLVKEKAEFEESLQKILKRDVKKGQPVIDILEINRLRRQLLFQSYMWDHRLIYAANLDNNVQDGLSCSTSDQEKSQANTEEVDVASKPGKNLSSCNSLPMDARISKISEGGRNTYHSDRVHREIDIGQDSNLVKKYQVNHSANNYIYGQCDNLETGGKVRRTVSEGQVPVIANLSDTLEAAWTGENPSGIGILKENVCLLSDSFITGPTSRVSVAKGFDSEDHVEEHSGVKVTHSLSPVLSTKGADTMGDSVSWLRMPFLNFYRSLNKNFLATNQKLDTLGEYNPVYVSSFRESELQGGARLLLPVGVNDTVVPVYDDEPTSIISYALVSPEYHSQVNDEGERTKDGMDFMTSFASLDSVSFHPISVDETASDSYKSRVTTDDNASPTTVSHSSLILDPLSYTKSMHVRVSFGDDGPLGNVKYSVTCYYAKRFENIRRICCPSELDYIRSLSRCKKWGAQGGKSNVFFAKTLDDRFIIKQVTKTELESFIKFAPAYFKYLSESIRTGSPTCLAKILGIYQVTAKHVKGGKESKMDVLVMENLLFRRNITQLYDLKGSSRSRYNPDSSGSNKVLLDQNLIESMPTSPIFVGNKAKRLLERAVWNDTSFLASIGVMDYSLLAGVDGEKHQLVIGIIDFMRQYTWDKHLETWVKASGILGGPKNSSPTVISPKEYKKRFRKAMTTYFIMVPDQWSPPIAASKSQTDLCEGTVQCESPVD